MQLKVLLLNSTFKKNTEESDTKTLLKRVGSTIEGLDRDVLVEYLHVNDYYIPSGISPDEQEGDEWSLILKKIRWSDILIIGTSVLSGGNASLSQIVLERLWGSLSSYQWESGHLALLGKVAGVIVCGNQSGAQMVAAHISFNLNNLGCIIPPNAYCYLECETDDGLGKFEGESEKGLHTNTTALLVASASVQMARLIAQTPMNLKIEDLTKKAKEMVL